MLYNIFTAVVGHILTGYLINGDEIFQKFSESFLFLAIIDECLNVKYTNNIPLKDKLVNCAFSIITIGYFEFLIYFIDIEFAESKRYQIFATAHLIHSIIKKMA